MLGDSTISGGWEGLVSVVLGSELGMGRPVQLLVYGCEKMGNSKMTYYFDDVQIVKINAPCPDAYVVLVVVVRAMGQLSLYLGR